MYPFFYAFTGSLAASWAWHQPQPAAFLILGAVLLLPCRWAFLAGALLWTAVCWLDEAPPEKVPETLTGYVSGVPKEYSFLLDTETGRFRIISDVEPEPGAYCTIEGAESTEAEPQAPYGYNQAAADRRDGVSGAVFTSAADCSGGGRGVNAFRAFRLNALEALGGSRPEAWVKALIYGSRESIDAEELNRYQQFGVIHLLAVSGMHVGLLTGMFWFILLRIGFTKQTAALAAVMFLPVYIILAGEAPSVIRAGSMAAAAALIYLFAGRKFDGMDLLGAAGIGMLCFEPFLVTSVGFQLSFLTSAVLLLSRPFFKEKGPLKTLILVSVTAQAGALPVYLYHFYEIPLLSAAANLLFVPAVGLVLLPFSAVSALLPPAGPVLFPVMEAVLHSLTIWLDLLERIPGTMWTIGFPGLLAPVSAAAVVFVFQTFQRQKIRVLSLVLLFIILTAGMIRPWDNNLYIHFLDVGQGDAVFIEDRESGKNYLVDTGGRVRYGGDEPELDDTYCHRNTAPFLKGRGAAVLHGVIITHDHVDHYGSLRCLSRLVRIDALYIPEAPAGAFLSEMTAEMAGEGTAVYPVDKDMQAGLLQLLPPDRLFENVNNQSILTLIQHKGKRVLLTGDIEEEAEAALVEAGRIPEVDVLKAAHHGSSSSSTKGFLDAALPEAVVISAGRDNRYGHPDEEVLRRFFERGITVYRTDESGTLTLQLDEQLEFQGYSRKPAMYEQFLQ
ncbi:DNA internalization-related competence protein ComEC/Rec2 [Alkalicoccus urumqiensis]|uniref:DNA internalization-related competence protein ComEC/Rec2 n=1 Tax=Alkalicoccus urumqiensis TaxID=1548213 RepID=A0A2P6MFL9_ALKUR|nr:DNA internalization-related competence protein ComEC/Rec2 [Alkalicoccus urumqiensis]PRO65084.1 DNA internalization-related competence protein ComEC/Rec2 [Alkalicoccus urumqiensis]